MAYNTYYGIKELSGYDIKTEAYRYLSMALFIATLTVAIMISLGVPMELYYLGSAGEFIIIIILLFSGLFRIQFSERTATILLFSFAVCSAITLSLLVMIGIYLDPIIIAGPVGITTIIVLAAYYFSGQTYKKIDTISRIAVFLAIGFIIISLLGLFLFSSNPIFYLIVSAFGAVIFSIYLFIDMARLENRAFTSPALMALWLFYDIIFLLKELIIIFLYIFGIGDSD